jgi:putative ABC transport system permease protein
MKTIYIKQKIPLAWLQLNRERGRLIVAMAGIAFADMLMFMQLGFRTALYDSNTMLHRTMDADLVLISPQGRNITNLTHFPRRRLAQALSFEGVSSARPLYTDYVDWKNPQTHKKTAIMLIGFKPDKSVFKIPEVEKNLYKLRYPDTVLFDRGSRGDYSKTLSALRDGQSMATEIRERKVQIIGEFLSGASFAVDANVMTSDQNFLRVFTNRDISQVSAGLIKLEPGINPKQMVIALKKALPNDVRVLTLEEFIQVDLDYWANNTPIGFIFALGAVIGYIVGIVIVYQILSSDVADHLAEYATLKAIGYHDNYILKIVIQESLILAVLGYIPGNLIAISFYALTRAATNIPLFMTLNLAVGVLMLTIMMCLTSCAVATRKLRAADPADIF